jgi:hypothetical protein
MATPRISTASAIAGLNSILALLNVGSAGNIKIYVGTAPTTLEESATGLLLATCPLSATAFPTAVDATDKVTATASTITGDTNASNDGDAGYFRGEDGNGLEVIQGTVTATAGGGDMEIDNITITTGDTVNVTAWTVTLPEL